MATKILGPTGSRRRRRFLVLGPIVLVFALLLPTLVFASAVPTTGGAVNDPRFEFDGNLLTELAQPGTLDWANPGNLAGHAAVISSDIVRTAAGSCTGSSTDPANFELGGPNRVGQGLLVCDGTISKQTPNDANGFTQGQHEDEGENPINWVIKAVSSPKKTDLSEVYIYGKVFDSPHDPDLLPNNLMFIFDAGRLDTNGDFHVDFEMNQAAQTDCGDTGQGSEFTFCQPRTVNDVLVSYDSVGGSAAPVATVFLWKTELDTGEECESSQGDINSPTLGGCYVLLENPPAPTAAEGVFNTTEIDAAPWKAVVCDPTSVESSQQCTLRSKIPAGGNMEGYIDVEGFVDGFDLCPGFGQISAKSRSSSGINASLQDTTGALPVDASICGSIIVEKLDGNGDPLPGASFTFNPDPADRDGTAEIADGGTLDAADANNGYVCVDDALFGQYSITETSVPAGYFGDADTATVNAVNPSTCADRLDEDGVPLDPDDVDASFENLKGSIIIEKVDGDGTLIPGAEFTLTPSPVTGTGTLDVLDGDDNDQADESDGRICIDDVFIVDNTDTDYTIVEKTPPPGWFGDDDEQTVTVTAPSTCADRLDDDPILADTEFVNEKGSIIIRKEAKNANTVDQHDLFGGATFRISPNPLTGAAMSTLDVTDDTAGNTMDVDQFGGAGLICIDDVVNLAGGSFSIIETNSNNAAYKKDDSTETVSVSAASSCADRGTSDDPDALFENIPLSKITVTFESLAGDGVTKAKIACPPEAADPNPDGTPNAFDDTSESFTDLVPTSPATYNCTVEIDP